MMSGKPPWGSLAERPHGQFKATATRSGKPPRGSPTQRTAPRAVQRDGNDERQAPPGQLNATNGPTGSSTRRQR